MKHQYAFVFSLVFLFLSEAWCLQVTPNYQVLALKPGEKASGEITLINTEEDEIHVIPTTKNWFVLPANKKFKVEDWLTVQTKEFSLKKGESKTLQFTTEAPKKGVGEFVGMVSLRTKSPAHETVEFVMSVAVYVAVVGTEKVDCRLAAFTVTPSSNSVGAGVLLQNTGNVHIRPRGMLRVSNDKSEVQALFELGRGQPTFPGNIGSYVKEVKDFHLEPGRYIADIDISDTDRQVQLVKTRKKFAITQEGKVELK